MSQRIHLRRRSPTLSPLPPLPPQPSYSHSPSRSFSRPHFKLPPAMFRSRLMRSTLLPPLLLLNAALLLALLVFPRVGQHQPYTRQRAFEGMDAWMDLVGSEARGSAGLEMPGGEFYRGGTGREGCGYCGPRDYICRQYGEHNLARSRAYEGPNTRLFRVLRKHQGREPLKIGVLGGSVTAGSGVPYADIWTHRFFQLFNASFPHPGNEFVAASVRGSGLSGYYGGCWGEHIDEDTDLIILELSTSDPATENTARDYELLLRSLLESPRRPAVVNVHVLGVEDQGEGVIGGAGEVQLGVAEYYDVPTISLRNVLLQHIFQREEHEDDFFVKTHENKANHAQMNDISHRMLADLLMSFVSRQACAMRTAVEDAMEWSEGNEIYPEFGGRDDVPRMSLYQKYDRSLPQPSLRPMCMVAGSPLSPLQPLTSNGWKFTWSDEDGKAQYRATRPGATVSFELGPMELGIVRVGYVKGRTQGLGSALCWVDDAKENGTTLHASASMDIPESSRAQYAQPSYIASQSAGASLPLLYDVDTPTKTETIASGLPVGPHVVSCELLREKGGGKAEFRIVSISGV